MKGAPGGFSRESVKVRDCYSSVPLGTMSPHYVDLVMGGGLALLLACSFHR